MSVSKPNYKISVITASYNYANYIRETIESVINQTYDNWELIVVDDGSSDNSVEIIKEYCKKDNRIKFFTHPDNQNLGLKDTLLLGIEKAEGEWIAFLESDDTFKPEVLKEKIKIAKDNPDVKIIFSDVEIFEDETSAKMLTEYLKKTMGFLCNKNFLQENDPDFFIDQNFVPTFSAVMAKREKLLQCNFNTPVRQYLDWFLWAQFAAEDFYYINKELTRWRAHKASYINSIDFKHDQLSEFKCKVINFVYSNKKPSLLNKIKHFLKCFKYFRRKIIDIRFKAGEIILFNKNYNFKKIKEQKAQKETSKNRVAVFAHWDKDYLIEDYVIYYLKNLKNIVQKIIFVSDCDVNKKELKKLREITDIVIAKKHGEYDFGSYKIGFIYAKENGLLENCDELIFANDSCYAPLFSFENMFEAMDKKQADFWGNTISFEHVKHIQSYFLAFSSKVFNSKVFEDFIKNIKKENSKDAVIKNYELTVTKLLEKNGFTCASYCGEYPDEMGGLHVRLWEKLIKEDKSPFIKTSVPRFKNIKIVSSLGWKRILKKHTNYNVNLIRKDLKRNRKKSDVFKEVLLTSKLVRRKIIRINFSKRKIHILGIDGADFPVIIKSKIKNLTIKKRGRTNPHTIKFLGKNPEMYN